jgi:hypothetical protein
MRGPSWGKHGDLETMLTFYYSFHLNQFNKV